MWLPILPIHKIHIENDTTEITENGVALILKWVSLMWNHYPI